MREIKFIKNNEITKKSRLTVQKSGRLGISKLAQQITGLDKRKFVKFGQDKKGNLFLFVTHEKDSETFRMSKAGPYYYINAKNLIKTLGIDY